MKRIVVFIVLLGLSGCGFVFQNFGEQKYRNLSRGMSKEEVRGMLGSPQEERTMKVGGREYEVWQYPKIKPGANQSNLLSTDYYKVFFLDDKVAQWDENMVFAQPSYEYLETIGPK